MAGGRPPKEKSFYNALSVALSQVDGVGLDGQRVTKLRTIAEKLVSSAIAGEAWAIKEIADRIDGKPAQAIAISGSLDTAPNRLTDEELESIAAASSAGATEAPPSPSKLN